MRRIYICPNCGSERREGGRCSACHDETAEQYWIRAAVETFVAQQPPIGEALNTDQLERDLEKALTAPPRPPWSHLFFA